MPRRRIKATSNGSMGEVPAPPPLSVGWVAAGATSTLKTAVTSAPASSLTVTMTIWKPAPV